MNKAKKWVDTILISLSSILLLTMVGLSLWQVLARYVLNISSPSTEELTRYLLIWFGLLTAAYVFGAKKHIAILFFREKFGPSTQLLIERITDILIIIVAGVLMVYGGIKVVLLTSAQTAAATGISMSFVYFSLPLSGFFIIFYTIHSIMTEQTAENEEVGV
ncbi:TRAP transporter small permease [Oceanobacillus halophilus]|uniref:TRAP transporter small permease n=1 Tax=Oceanobacillus halophilus TaxID=930130 RepID=A0A494ZZC0_9BACI|nr:TRAP transporter small permease [Oceanobacillus halophilus]RKQ32299.1 TRAP transporter small permease [Oceanobacillus halophilus]